MLKRLSISLGVTLTISALLAWPVTYVGVNFYAGVVFFSALQFVLNYFYRDYIEKKIAIEEERLIVAREAELSKQGTTVVCPCDRAVQCFIPIKLNETNEYSCPGCKKQINVHVNFKTAVATIPIIDDAQAVLRQQLQGAISKDTEQ